ncbi:MAG: hypothetical protein HDR04_18455 [Lachnospiraceae bacterium]|nr:hypothetical protein [Lachnospiraceae bacterium]
MTLTLHLLLAFMKVGWLKKADELNIALLLHKRQGDLILGEYEVKNYHV